MITQNYQVLAPAYGRDYKNGKAAIADFESGKDFVLNSYQGTTYTGIEDFAPGVTVNLRYRKLRNVAVYRVKP